MSHYTLGWHDQQHNHHEISEYANDAFEAVFYSFPCVVRIFTYFVMFVLLVVPTECVVGHDSFNSSTYVFSIARRYNYAVTFRFPHINIYNMTHRFKEILPVNRKKNWYRLKLWQLKRLLGRLL